MPLKTPSSLCLSFWHLLALCASLLALPSHAEKADRDQPMQIEADSMRHDQARQLTQFTGKVLATKGTLVLRAARMEVQQDAQGRQVARLWAAPSDRVFFRQKREGVNEFTEGEAEQVTYDNQADVITLNQRAEVRILRGNQVADQLNGHTIVFNNTTEVMTVDGQATSGPGQRVRAILTPRNTPPAPTSDTPIAPALRASPVHDVSVQVEKGEVVGLLGPNGAGKTTSFYMIVGLVRADGGQILIDGEDVTRMPIHKRSRMGLSYLPQEASIFRKLSVADNVRAILELQTDAQGHALSSAKVEKRLSELLADLRVDHLRDSPSLALSGGERRRVEIARALATDPRFILLDEPFAGIDPIAVIEIQRIIAFLKQRGIGVLITDHNVRETLGICDHAYIISEGRVLAQGTPDEIVANADVRRVYLGEHFRM